MVFWESALSYGLVNLKPIFPGHVLICPKRVVARLSDLSEEEVSDLYSSVWRVAPQIERHFQADALNIAMQDGVAAGQSVPHVHVHILPRKKTDVPTLLRSNDEVYEKLDNQRLQEQFSDVGRRVRTWDEMAEEAIQLRQLFKGTNGDVKEVKEGERPPPPE